jgi:hypothetical protein
MTTVEKWAPVFLWRTWDKDWKQISQSSDRPPRSALPEGGAVTLDFPSGQRRTWRVRDGHLIDEAELLESITIPRNPIFDNIGSDDSQWSIIHTRFQDPLDFLAEAAPEEPFVQQMLAERERIRRTYAEITASVPEGLTKRERDEYIAARVMQSIAGSLAEERP